MDDSFVRQDATPVLAVPHRPYRSALPLVPWVTGLAMASVAIEIALLVTLLMDRRAPLVEVLSTLVSVPLVVVGVGFFALLARNRPALGQDAPKWATAWAWLGWLIPVVWWVLPYFVVRELWVTSEPDVDTGPEAAAVPPWFNGWWALWVASGVLNWSYLAWLSLADIRPSDIATIPSGLRLLGAASTLLLAAALFPFLRLVRTLPARQDERRGRLTRASISAAH